MVLLPNFNPVEGLTTDAAGALTHEGQLRQIVANTGLPTGGTVTVAAVAVLAGVPTTTNQDLLAGGRLYAACISSAVAAGTRLDLFQGTAGAVGTSLLIGVAPVVTLGMERGGIAYGTNTRLWVQSAVAGTVYVTAWSA